jgi:ABC-2 type transport system ATP-binding protein
MATSRRRLAICLSQLETSTLATALQFVGVTKLYKSFWNGRKVCALDDFSLSVEPGEIFGFLGPNGAGKTTAIHLAVGFMRPTYGRGSLLGAPFGDVATRRRVGFLAENVSFYHRPAGKLVRFYGELNGMREPQLSRRMRRVLQAVDLEAEAGRNVGKFSRGMLQRVGLAQALVNDPDLLILDEPTSALDPLNRVAVRETLLAARNAGKTIFLSSHLLSEIELICDRIGILNEGRLVRVGRTTDMLESHEDSEIIARGSSVDVIGGAEATGNGQYRFLVRTSQVRPMIERVWAVGGEVIRVNPVRRTLEELFVELIAPPPSQIPATAEHPARAQKMGN